MSNPMNDDDYTSNDDQINDLKELVNELTSFIETVDAGNTEIDELQEQAAAMVYLVKYGHRIPTPAKQPSTTDPDATADIEAWLEGEDEGREHTRQVFYEHGQHFASCPDCGASWSIQDAEPGPYCLEQLDEGDETCC